MDRKHNSEYNNTKPQKKRKTTTTTQVIVPTERLNDVERLLERLDMRDQSRADEKMVIDNENQHEVTSVCGHNIENGEWYFKVRFSGFPQYPEWVSDDDCRCETHIQTYLAKHAPHVRTCYLFCRVSSKNQTGPTHVSLAAQEAQLRQTASTLELEDGEVLRVKVVSISASAYRGIPTQLQQIAEVARPRDIIMIYRVDRLSRNIVRFLSMLEDVNDKRVLIYAQDEDLWYHDRKLDFIQGILDANKESTIISKRVKMSVNHRRQRGDYIGCAPYGWKLQRDPATKVVSKVRNPQEQAVIQRIKTLQKEDKTIANLLNNENVLKRGKAWTANMVGYVKENN